jgi:hypothetical protein
MAKSDKMLMVSAVNVQAVPVDWSEMALDEFGSSEDSPATFSYYEMGECYRCGEPTLEENGCVSHYSDSPIEDDYEDELEPSGYCVEDLDATDGPMMNYAYELPYFSEGSLYTGLERIKDLPLCIVKWKGSYWLALTGGGMDLSWEICEAYIALGYLPPAVFAELPAMSGRGTSQEDREVIKYCKETFEVVRDRAKQSLARMKSIWGKK